MIYDLSFMCIMQADVCAKENIYNIKKINRKYLLCSDFYYITFSYNSKTFSMFKYNVINILIMLS